MFSTIYDYIAAGAPVADIKEKIRKLLSEDGFSKAHINKAVFFETMWYTTLTLAAITVL